MRCFKCNEVLTKESHCPNCGIDVSMYKKAVMASNAYYNLGLSKAKVRDLSGAVESLKMSITINKKNIDARNLLGLVYCEMGDVVEALSEWVISKNIQPDNNCAEDYITDIQSNQNKFELVTSTIKKYNLSLRYAKYRYGTDSAQKGGFTESKTFKGTAASCSYLYKRKGIQQSQKMSCFCIES